MWRRGDDDPGRCPLGYVSRQPPETRTRLLDPRGQAGLTCKSMLRRSALGHHLRVPPPPGGCPIAAEPVPTARRARLTDANSSCSVRDPRVWLDADQQSIIPATADASRVLIRT